MLDTTLTPPSAGTVERWAFDYILTRELDEKLAPPPMPDAWETAPAARRLARPGRASTLRVVPKSAKTPGPEALRKPALRAQLIHTFLHHELQAAELMAWALLAFADAPSAFRRGLARILLDEVRHMKLYAEHLASLGHRYGEFPVRDWFWERIPTAPTAMHFVAVMGIGFEGGNLDHTARFAALFRSFGDELGVQVQERICAEEVSHVQFALHWFSRWAGCADFSTWTRHLPPPLSPLLMRGKTLNVADRLRSGLSPEFLDELERWSARAPGS